MQKTQLQEGLSDNISDALEYVFFVDLYPIATKKGGLSTIMFQNIDHNRMVKWLGGVEKSDLYSENEDKLKEMYSKISVSSALKDLYRTINVLKSKETPSEENDSRIEDIEMVMRKIKKTIKTKLSEEELDLFNQMSDLLDDAAENAAKSIEGSVGASTKESEPEEEETEETPEETPEEPTEEPTETPSDDEIEEMEDELRMEAYLKSVIREIIEKKLKLK